MREQRTGAFSLFSLLPPCSVSHVKDRVDRVVGPIADSQPDLIRAGEIVRLDLAAEQVVASGLSDGTGQLSNQFRRGRAAGRQQCRADQTCGRQSDQSVSFCSAHAGKFLVRSSSRRRNSLRNRDARLPSSIGGPTLASPASPAPSARARNRTRTSVLSSCATSGRDTSDGRTAS